MTKVACNQCGALILPRTAAQTGGICMACKQGIRASMDASRDYYQKLKEYDPYRELWKWLVGQAEADPSLDGFSAANRTYFAVVLLEGELYNGGFDQFFTNSSGDHYADAVAGLEVLGARHALTLLQEAATLLFGSELPPADRQQRWDAMQRNTEVHFTSDESDEVTRKVEALDQLFWADPDLLNERLTAFAKQSGILKPFEKEP